MNQAVSCTISKPALRAVAAFALTAGSFVALRQLFRGSCVIPFSWGIAEPLFLFAALFLAGFVWLVFELARMATLAGGIEPVLARRVSWAVGAGTYAVVGFVAWLSEPVALGIKNEAGFRAFMAVFWSVGFLLKAGNFWEYSCGGGL
jgi:hypothetical protein